MGVLGKIETVATAARSGAAMIVRAGRLAIEGRFANTIPSRPTVLQFPVNDICNSRCVMCNIWQRKRDHEITPDELAEVLRSRLFSRIRFVGINGGEPTLRRDLDQIATALADGLPRLREVHIITNAIRHADATARILSVRDVLASRGIRLSVGVSIDGVGEDHDQHRGVPGNFESARRVVESLQTQRIPLSVGCTLTAHNCYAADDVLEWCESRGIHDFEFRLGVEIKRVYNEGFSLLNPLSDEQRFHLAMFFDKLAHRHGVKEANRRFYRSLVDQVAFGAPRTAGCHWKTRGVTLDTRGGISYCSVASDVVGSALERDGWAVFKQGLPERRRIAREACGDCRHDLLGPPPAREMLKQGLATAVEPFVRRIRRPAAWPVAAPVASVHPPRKRHVSQWQDILITGWYGTETAGDKAILAEVVAFFREHVPGCRLSLTTIDRKVSEQTSRELPELAALRLVPLHEAAAQIEKFDAVVVGGGPLEDVGEMRHVHELFLAANRHGCARVLFGCGIGPFHRDHTRAWAQNILRTTTHGFVRDRASLELARTLGAPDVLAVGCDPALRFLVRWARENPVPAKHERRTIAGLLRANTSEYVGGQSDATLAQMNSEAAAKLAAVLDPVCAGRDATARLLPMHSIWVGGDDRVFARRVAKHFGGASRASVERRYLPLQAVLRELAACDAAVAMRYHGHLFCMALGVPMLSIDYTGARGKVGALIDRIGYAQWCQDWTTLDPTVAASQLDALLDQRDSVSLRLREEAARLVQELEAAYAQAFDVDIEATGGAPPLRAAA